MRRSAPDVVYYLPKSGLTDMSLLRVSLLRRLTRRPIVLGCMQADVHGARLARMLRVDATVVPSGRLAAVLRSSGLATDVIPLGVNHAIFKPDGCRRVDLWPDRPGARLLHVGHITQRRNLGIVAELSRRGHNCLVIGSPATEPDGRVVDDLREAGVTMTCELVSDIASVYRGADAYVFPVIDPRGCIESPLSVLEAAACGTPIVASRFGALPSLAASLGSIRFVDNGGGFSAAVDEAILVARPTHASIPDWKAVARAHIEVFERVLAAERRPRLVVLLGVDGTGKSTQATLLASDAERRGVSAVTVWSRWDPLLLRPLMWFARRFSSPGTTSAAKAYENTVRIKRRIFRGSAARRAWEWLASLDHCVQTVPRILAARHRASLVIADRYYHDALVDMESASVPHRRGHMGSSSYFRDLTGSSCSMRLKRVVFGRKRDVPSIRYLEQRRPLYLELTRANGWPYRRCRSQP